MITYEKVNPVEKYIAKFLLELAEECNTEECPYLRDRTVGDGTKFYCSSPEYPEPPRQNIDEINYREISIIFQLSRCLGIKDKKKCYYLPEAEKQNNIMVSGSDAI